MGKIKTKIIVSVILCALMSAVICGGISIINSSATSYDNSRQEMLLNCENQSMVLNSMMEKVEQSVDTLYSVSLQKLDDVEAFKTSKAYVDEYTKEMESILEEFAGQTDGALTAYIRYNPEFTEPDSGLFLTRDNSESAFTSVTPTDFSMYDPSDLEHVGWYYIPVERKKPTWMSPYLNSNINVYMVSYVIPIYIDGESIGIIGMDIDFRQFTDVIDQSGIFETGYAYLADENGQIMYHPTLEVGTAVADCEAGMQEVSDALRNAVQEQTFVGYRYQGVKKDMCYTVLTNGMRYILTAPEAELKEQAKQITGLIMGGTVIAIIISVLVGIFIALTVTRPITKISSIVGDTAEFNFVHNPDNEKLYKRKDESGQMAKSLHNMRKNLRKMVADIRKAYTDLQATMVEISETTRQVNAMSAENSDTTQELAAAMEETAATMEDVNRNIVNVRGRAEEIKKRSDEGRKTSIESKERADELKKATDEASKKTTDMYENVQIKTEAAMEQARAVDKINQLTQAILEISSQTNLLALNASIEAARAGEAGRGFAVVADEIGQLASQTSSTAGNINGIISEVNEAVGNMSNCLKESMDFLEGTVLKDYDNFMQVAEQYTEDAAGFENGMTVINSEVQTLLDSIVDIADAVDGVSTTVAEAAEEVTNVAQKTQDVAGVVEGNASLMESNQENIIRLKKIIDMFRDEK
ncbi:MAG: methyl-accepting chemotaxis protein [Clostridiales bacterium]|nr:methyl-accepting chemotaxis protein [Clostridiales bacterium]